MSIHRPSDSEEHDHVRHRLYRHRGHLLRRLPGLHAGLREVIDPMLFDSILGGVVCVGLLVYLVYALLRPEHF